MAVSISPRTVLSASCCTASERSRNSSDCRERNATAARVLPGGRQAQGPRLAKHAHCQLAVHVVEQEYGPAAGVRRT